MIKIGLKCNFNSQRMLLSLFLIFSNCIWLAWCSSQIPLTTLCVSGISCISINLVLDLAYVYHVKYHKFSSFFGINWAAVKACNLLIFIFFLVFFRPIFETDFNKWTYVMSISIFWLGVFVAFLCVGMKLKTLRQRTISSQIEGDLQLIVDS